MEEREEELRTKRICRFCMTQEEPLTNIYSRENRIKNSVPLPLQIMACVSLEVFNTDGMPCTICTPCRILMDRSYRFKQICKKSDSSLRLYPATGIWPECIPLPEDIAQTIMGMTEVSSKRSQSQNDMTTPQPSKKIKTDMSLSQTDQRQGSVGQEEQKAQPKILNTQSSNVKNAAPKTINIKKAHPDSDLEEDSQLFEIEEGGDENDYSEDENESESSQDEVRPAAQIETDVYPCELCERSFPLRQLLDIHMRHHTRERSFMCSLCKKSFFSKYDLGKHMSVHTGIKPYSCVACGKTFARATLLHRHEKVHVDTPKFLCNTCDKTFLSMEELDRHEQNHKKRRPFSCKKCNKSFAFKQGLERHEVTHSKNKPFNCEYCDEGFTTPGKLARHVTAHAGSRPYPCKLCPKSFLLSHHLSRHIKSHGPTGPGPVTHYKCEECDKVFLRKDDLIYHSAVHATQSLTCPLCKEQFNDIDAVTEHIKSHTDGEQFACDFCDLIFTSEDKLLIHTDQIHAIDDEEENILPDDDFPTEIKQELEELVVPSKPMKQFSKKVVEPTKLVKAATPKVIPQKVVQQSEVVIPEPVPTRRSQRSGKVRDYARMIKNDFDSDDDSGEDDGEISTPEKVEKTVVKDKSEQLKTYGHKAKRIEDVNKDTAKISESRTTEKSKSDAQKKVENSPKQVAVKKVPTSKTESIQNMEIISKLREFPHTTISKVPDVSKNTSSRKTVEVKKPETPKKVEVVKNTDIDKKQTPAAMTMKQVDLQPVKKLTPLPGKPVSCGPIVEMKIGEKMVKVQKIMMTKAEVEAMAKQGKIEMKGGAMVLKQGTKFNTSSLAPRPSSSDKDLERK